MSAPFERQEQTFQLVYELVGREYRFEDKDAVRDYFTRLTGLFKNLNYSSKDGPDYPRYRKEIDALAGSVA